MGEKVTEIDDRANGMSMFPMAMSVKASDGEVRSAMQLVEESDNLRISENSLRVKDDLDGRGWDLLRVACANWVAQVARVMSVRLACRFFPVSAGMV